jgi:hypothetical protein
LGGFQLLVLSLSFQFLACLWLAPSYLHRVISSYISTHCNPSAPYCTVPHHRGSIESKGDLELLILALGSTPSARELDDFYRDLTSGEGAGTDEGEGGITFQAFYSWWCGHVGRSLKLTRK